MSQTLRDAAQALVTFVDEGGAVPDAARIFADLRSALATPDTDRWAEGYRAGLEAAAREVTSWGVESLSAGTKAVVARIATTVAGLPVPPATTREPSGTAGELPSAPAPEAKTAESEVGVTAYERAERDAQFVADCDALPLTHCDNFGGNCDGCSAWEDFKRRVDARRAPVEPEETQR